MAPRLSLLDHSLLLTDEEMLLSLAKEEIDEIPWLAWLEQQTHDRLMMRQMICIQKVIERLELPCQFTTEAEIAQLRIYARNAEANPPHARPVPLLVLRETQVPRGEQPHPRLGTLGNAWLSRIAFDESNETRCNAIGINPGSLRPGSIHPTR
jgi:hypothetical protein